MSRQRRLSLLAAATSAVLLLAACSSAAPHHGSPELDPGVSFGSATGPADPTSSDPPVAATPSTSTDAPTLNPLTATFTAPDGTTVTMDLRLSKLLRMTDPGVQAAWSHAGGSASMACDADPQRDALYVGSVAFTNTTPSFTPDLMIFFNPNGSGMTNLSVGVGYTNQPTCTAVAPSTTQATLAPTFSSPQWGPVPIELVVHDFYSPQFPGGNIAMISRLDPTLFATVGQPINGVAYKVSGLSDGVLKLENLR